MMTALKDAKNYLRKNDPWPFDPESLMEFSCHSK